MAETNEPTYEEDADDDEQQLVYTASHEYDEEASGDHMVRVVSPLGVFAEFVGTPGAELVILTPPNSDSVNTDDDLRLQAHIKYADSEMQPRQVTGRAEWESSAREVATVGTKTGQSKGLLSGKKTGQTTVTARFGGLKATKKVRVEDAQGRDLRIDPASGDTENPTVEAGDDLPLRSTVASNDGETTAVTNKTRWSTSDKEIATVDNSGVVKGVSAGEVDITGKYRTQEGKTLATKLKVTVEAELDGDKTEEQEQDQAPEETPEDNEPEMPEDDGEDTTPEGDEPDAEIPEDNAPEGGDEAPANDGGGEGDQPADGGVEPQYQQ